MQGFDQVLRGSRLPQPIPKEVWNRPIHEDASFCWERSNIKGMCGRTQNTASVGNR